MAASKASSKASSGSSPAKPTAAAPSSLGFIDVLRILGGLALVSTVASYLVTNGESYIWGIAGEKRPWWTDPAALRRAWVSIAMDIAVEDC